MANPNIRQALSYSRMVQEDPAIIKAEMAFENQRNAIGRLAGAVNRSYDSAKAGAFDRQPGFVMFRNQRARTPGGFIKAMESQRQQYQKDFVRPLGNYGDQVLGGKYSLDVLKPILKEMAEERYGEHTSHIPDEVLANIGKYLQPSQFSLPELTRGMTTVADIRRPFSESMFDRASRNVNAASINLAQPPKLGPNLPTMEDIANTMVD